MPQSQQTRLIDIPIRVVFTDEGVTYFMQRNRQLQRFRLSDTRDEFGIKLTDFSAGTVQKLLLKGYISKIELPISDITERRSGVIDFTKLLTYGMLYQQFDSATYGMVVNSDMVRHWNRRNARHPIDFQTTINADYIDSLLKRNANGVAEVRREIMEPVQQQIRLDTRLIDQEKRIRLLTAERYLDSMNPLSWFILSLYRGSRSYTQTVPQLRDELATYLEKTSIGEYLALMLLEVLTNVKAHARAQEPGEDTDDEMYILFKVKKHRNVEHDRGRLHVIVANDRTNFEEVQSAIREKSKTVVREKSLNDFYEAEAGGENAIDLGLYYLSFVQEACREVNIHFQSFVHQMDTTGQTLINLVLTF
jgi:septum formation topological specificity factor MinE